MTTVFKHENIIKLAGVLGVAPELRLTSGGNTVATLIVYTNYILRNEDGSTRQESERHRVIVWGMHAEKVARLLRKGYVQGRGVRRPGYWRLPTTVCTIHRSVAEPRSETMTDGNRRTDEGRIGAVQDLVMDGLPPCTMG